MAVTPPDRIAQFVERRSSIVLLMYLGWIVSALALLFLPDRVQWIGLAAMFAVPVAVLAVLEIIANRRKRGRAEARYSAIPEKRIADVGDEPAHFKGTIRAIQTVTNGGGVACVAFRETKYVDGTPDYPVCNGGRFTVDDGSGEQAVIDAGCVLVTSESETGNVVIPDGAYVEIVGNARREVGSADDHTSPSLRASASVVRIDGTPTEPVVLRLCREVPAASGKLRVAAVEDSREVDLATDAADERSPAQRMR